MNGVQFASAIFSKPINEPSVAGICGLHRIKSMGKAIFFDLLLIQSNPYKIDRDSMPLCKGLLGSIAR